MWCLLSIFKMLIYWFMIAISYWFTHCPLLDLFRLHQELLNILFWHTFFVLSKILPSSSGWYNIPPVYDLLNEASGFTSWPNFAIYPNPLKKKKNSVTLFWSGSVQYIIISSHDNKWYFYPKTFQSYFIFFI